jgi:L-ornithine N5-oxygenase
MRAADTTTHNHRSPDLGEIYDVFGVGFGPANIALAVAQEDVEEGRPPQRRLRSLFLERAPDATWQPAMLLRGTDIQHHFLRDFATPRNPRSRFTFPYYLWEKGRLCPFGLLEGNPSRIEWNDYIQWVAGQLTHRVLYEHRVTAIEPLPDATARPIALVRVWAEDLRSGAPKAFYARNVVFGTGRKPYVPGKFAPLLGPRVFHSSTFLTCMQALCPGAPPVRFAVIGGGQSAGEVVLYLANHFPASPIFSIQRGPGFQQGDHSPHSNVTYLPEEVDYVFNLSKAAQRQHNEAVERTNYGSVDAPVCEALHQRMYEEVIQGIRRIQIVRWSAVVDILSHQERFELVVENILQHCTSTIPVDVVVLCTGYVEDPIPACMEPLRPYLQVDADGDLVVSRDYAVETDDRIRIGLYLNGLTERTHGLSDAASFSMMALKAQRIWERLETRGQLTALAAAVDSHPATMPAQSRLADVSGRV